MNEQDKSHLNLLGIFYYISGAINAVVLLIMVIFGGVALVATVAASRQDPEAAIAAIIITVVFGFSFLLVGTITVLTFLAAHGLQNCQRKILIYIVAALSCMSVPLGTILGVFTFIVMARPGVPAAFDTNALDAHQSLS